MTRCRTGPAACGERLPRGFDEPGDNCDRLCAGEAVYQAAARLLDNADAYSAMAQAVNPFGDGYAAARIVSRLAADLATVDPASPAAAYGARPGPRASEMVDIANHAYLC